MRPFPAPVLLLLFAACTQPPPVAQPDDVSIEVGRPFPNLALPSLADGSPASVAQFRGKKTLLHVFASW